MGLVSVVVDVGELDAEVSRRAAMIARAPRRSLLRTKAKALQRSGIAAGLVDTGALTMRELVYLAPGDVRWREAPEPRLEGPGEALVRPVAVACCDLDVAVAQGRARFPLPTGSGTKALPT